MRQQRSILAVAVLAAIAGCQQTYRGFSGGGSSGGGPTDGNVRGYAPMPVTSPLPLMTVDPSAPATPGALGPTVVTALPGMGLATLSPIDPMGQLAGIYVQPAGAAGPGPDAPGVAVAGPDPGAPAGADSPGVVTTRIVGPDEVGGVQGYVAGTQGQPQAVMPEDTRAPIAVDPAFNLQPTYVPVYQPVYVPAYVPPVVVVQPEYIAYPVYETVVIVQRPREIRPGVWGDGDHDADDSGRGSWGGGRGSGGDGPGRGGAGSGRGGTGAGGSQPPVVVTGPGAGHDPSGRGGSAVGGRPGTPLPVAPVTSAPPPVRVTSHSGPPALPAPYTEKPRPAPGLVAQPVAGRPTLAITPARPVTPAMPVPPAASAKVLPGPAVSGPVRVSERTVVPTMKENKPAVVPAVSVNPAPAPTRMVTPAVHADPVVLPSRVEHVAPPAPLRVAAPVARSIDGPAPTRMAAPTPSLAPVSSSAAVRAASPASPASPAAAVKSGGGDSSATPGRGNGRGR